MKNLREEIVDKLVNDMAGSFVRLPPIFKTQVNQTRLTKHLAKALADQESRTEWRVAEEAVAVQLILLKKKVCQKKHDDRDRHEHCYLCGMDDRLDDVQNMLRNAQEKLSKYLKGEV